MFSRGRPCLRRRLSTVLDTLAPGPDEPLLFLYPQCAASTLGHGRQFTSPTPAKPPVKSRQTRSCSCRPTLCPRTPSSPLVRRQSRQWIFSSAATAQAHDGSGSEVFPVQSKDGEKSVGIKDIEEDAGSDRDPDNASATRSNSTAESATPESLSERPSIESTTENTPTEHSNTTPSNGVTRTANSARTMSVRDRRKLRNARSLKNRKRNLQHSARTWDDIRALLEKIENDPYTRMRKGTKHKEILIPEETVALLAGIADTSMKENIWYVHVRNGCRVQVLHPREGDGVHRRAILSGTEHVMDLVEDHFKRAHHLQTSGDPLIEVAKPPFPIFPSTLSMSQQNKPIPLIRGIWALDKQTSMTLQDVLASRPTLNSVRDFTEHIEDLTLLREPRVEKQQPDPTETPHRELVARQISASFLQDSNNHKFISTAALDCALKFLCKNEFLRTARAVFSRAEQVATVDTYNILLKAAARHQSLTEFRRLLQSMLRTRVRPNPQTWLALLEGLVTPSAKASLINQMAHKGYMNDISTIRSALQLTIEDSLLAHLESGQSVDAFVLLMTRTYGANWFSSSLLAQMFAVTARLEDYTAMKRLLKICVKYRLPLENDSLLQVLAMFQGNVFAAVDYTIEFLNCRRFKLSPEAYERLFLIAFKARRFNICRVLWRYACLDEAVTYDMKKTVISSLSRNVSIKASSNDRNNIWLLNAGKIIVGIDLHLEKYKFHQSIVDKLPSEFRHNPLLYLTSGFKEQGPARDLQHRLARHLIQRDLNLGATAFRPRGPLGILLESAAIVDREWGDKPWPVTWMMQNAIRVELIRCRVKKSSIVSSTRFA